MTIPKNANNKPQANLRPHDRTSPISSQSSQILLTMYSNPYFSPLFNITGKGTPNGDLDWRELRNSHTHYILS